MFTECSINTGGPINPEGESIYLTYLLPPSFKECTSNFLGKSNFFIFDRVYIIIHQHLCHQISSIRFVIKYTFIIYLFDFTNIDIFLHKLGQTLKQFDPPTKLEVHSLKDGGSIDEHSIASSYMHCWITRESNKVYSQHAIMIKLLYLC